MKIAGPGRAGTGAANRDTTAQIGENCFGYFTPHRLTRDIIYTQRSGKMFNWKNGRLWAGIIRHISFNIR